MPLVCQFCRLRAEEVRYKGWGLCRACYLMGERAARLLGSVLHPENRKRSALRMDERRKELGLTYRGLAEKAGLPASAVITYLDPERSRWPRAEGILKLAVGLGMTPNEVLGWPDLDLAPQEGESPAERRKAEQMAMLDAKRARIREGL